MNTKNIESDLYYPIRHFNNENKPCKLEFIRITGIPTDLLTIMKQHRCECSSNGSHRFIMGFYVTQFGFNNVFTRDQVNAINGQQLFVRDVVINNENNNLFNKLMDHIATWEWNNNINV